MSMLTQEDLKQIGNLLVENNKVLKTEIVTEVVEQVGEMFEQNFLPAVGVLIEDKIAPLRAIMVTKSYLDDKLADVNGKINVLTDVLHRNGTITDAQRGIVRAA